MTAGLLKQMFSCKDKIKKSQNLEMNIFRPLFSFPFIILFVFLVPGSIDLSTVFGLKMMKTQIGIDLDGIRLILFCFVSGVFLIRKGTLSKEFTFYYIFLLYSFISILYTSDLLEGMRFGAKLIVPPLIYMVAKSISLPDFERINKAFIFVIFLHFLSSLPVLLQWFKPATYPGDIPRASGLTGARVIFGTFMLFIFILFYYRNLILRKGNIKRGYLPILISSFSIILSGARIAWIGMALAMVWLGLFKKMRSILIILVLTITLVALFQPLLWQRLGLQFKGEKLLLQEHGGGGTVRHRIIVWEWLFKEKIPRRVFAGYGLGSTRSILSSSPEPKVSLMDYPHNEYIRILLEEGVIGLSLFCFSYLYLALRFIKRYKRILYILPVIIYLTCCTVDNTLNNYFENGAVFSYILAYLEAYLSSSQEEN